MNIMTNEELDRLLESDAKKLAASLNEYKKVKAKLREDRIASIATKFLAPYRRFRIEQAIAKYDAMIEKIEKKREKEIRKAEKLQEKEQKLERKQAKADFKAAIRDKRKEDIVNFVNDRKDDVIDFANDKKSDVIDFGKDIGSEVSDTFDYIKKMGANRVSSVSSFVSNVSNSTLKKVRENTTIDLTIKNAIEDIQLKYATAKFNRAVEQKKKEEEKAREQELDDAINFDEGVKIELKDRDVPFSNINEKTQKARKQWSYMGKATNRVVRYFKSKKDNLFSDIHSKALETEGKMIVNAYDVMGRVSKGMSQIKTVFNSEFNDIKDIAKGRYNDIKRDIKNNMDRVSYAYQDYKDENEAKREGKEQDLAIKRAQLDSMREALKAVNNTGDVFADAPSLSVGRAMK